MELDTDRPSHKIVILKVNAPNLVVNSWSRTHAVWIVGHFDHLVHRFANGCQIQANYNGKTDNRNLKDPGEYWEEYRGCCRTDHPRKKEEKKLR